MAKRRHRKFYRGPSLTAHLAVQPGDRLQLRLGEMNEAGEATATLDGALVSVAGGIPGEMVTAEVLRVFPDRVAAKVVEVMEASSDRGEAPCPYFLVCTGCQWQHVSYDRQLSLKRERVAAELRKWPALAQAEVLPALPSPRQLGYRNHARFTARRHEGHLGFVNAATRQFVRIERCLLMTDRINETLAALQDRMQGQTQVSVRAALNGGSMLVQPRLTSSELGLQSGQKHYEECLDGLTFRIAASSFFQVNTEQISRVAGVLREFLGLTGRETVVDAYSGVGTFAVLLAPHAGRVIAIEESASAVTDARLNAAGLDNVEFMEARTEEGLAELSGRVDAVVLDPPRRGCSEAVLEALCRLRPRRVALVSCEPSAMARDLARLCEQTFILERVQPVDMFPQTRHVEAVAELRLTEQDERNGDG